MKKRAITMLLLIGLNVFLVKTTMECGSNIVAIGEDTQTSVLAKCGKPLMRDSIGTKTYEKGFATEMTVEVERWAYEWQRIFYYLTFEGNQLVSIEMNR